MTPGIALARQTTTKVVQLFHLCKPFILLILQGVRFRGPTPNFLDIRPLTQESYTPPFTYAPLITNDLTEQSL
jgi:hypothetical protein